jgi:hypothetical protein
MAEIFAMLRQNVALLAERFEGVYRHSFFGRALLVGFTALAFYWYWHVPTVGYAVGFLAVVAAIMATQKNAGGLFEFLWILLLFGFLFIEMRAINDDKKKATEDLTKHFDTISQQAQKNLRDILDDEHKNFKDILTKQQGGFDSTIKELVRQERGQNREFNALLAKQQELFEHEEQLAEYLGGQLIPGNSPTPVNGCGPVPKKDMVVIIGDEKQGNGAVVHNFPHTILTSHTLGPIVILQKTTADSPAMINLQMRSADGKIIALLDQDGFLANRNNLLAIRRDKGQHNLSIIDQYGIEVLRVHYINPGAISVAGRGIGFSARINMICSSGSGAADFGIP